MTEEEWMTATNPTLMLEFLKGKVSERKLRLFAVLCYREYLRFRPDLNTGIFPRWADVTERYAEGTATFEEWEGVRVCVHGTFHDVDPHKQALFSVDTAFACCQHEPSEALLLARFLRDIFGNHFRPVTFNPAWRTSDVLLLAQGIYDDRAFDRMPILADALQDAGCNNADVLNHCRDTHATHVRGCWVVDLVLGKE
jgi:hypothetical protein